MDISISRCVHDRLGLISPNVTRTLPSSMGFVFGVTNKRVREDARNTSGGLVFGVPHKRVTVVATMFVLQWLRHSRLGAVDKVKIFIS